MVDSLHHDLHQPAQDSLIHDLPGGLGTGHSPLCTNLGSTVQNLGTLET